MKVTVMIIADDSGYISLETTGPIKGHDGLVAILEESLKMAKQAKGE